MLAIDGTVTGQPDRAGPLLERRPRRLAERQPRVGLLAAADRSRPRASAARPSTRHVPHTVRGRPRRKQCTDCHVSAGERQQRLDGAAPACRARTSSTSSAATSTWPRARRGLEAVVVTERDEPQAVIGSHLHELAYPTNYQQHAARGSRPAGGLPPPGPRRLDCSAGDEVLSIQLRGEYLYTANGPGGFRVYDVANIDNKGFSERIVTAPVSPLGQRLYVKTKYATAVASPTTLARRPDAGAAAGERRSSRSTRSTRYLYVTDREEGLVSSASAVEPPAHAARRRSEQQLPRSAPSPSTPTACSTAPSTSPSPARYAYVLRQARPRRRRPRRPAPADGRGRGRRAGDRRARAPSPCSSATPSSPTARG